MNIVFLSHSPFHPRMVVGSHQLARSYAQAGHRVLHISLPFSLAHTVRLGRPRMLDRLRASIRGPYEIEVGLFEWVPFCIFPWELARSVYKRSGTNLTIPMAWRTQRALREAGISQVDLVFQDEPRMRGMTDHFSHGRLVYRAVDLYSCARHDLVMAEAEKQLVGLADRVVATSAKVADHLHDLDPSEHAEVVPNGFDASLFAGRTDPHRTLSTKNRPRAVYVGAIDERFDFSAIRMLAEEMTELELLLYGPGFRGGEQDWPENVSWMGSLAYQEIPSVLQHCDIALLPFCDSPVNHGRSPMKYHEYRAAGLPIVSFAIESLQQKQDGGLFLYPSERYQSISDAARAALEYSRTNCLGEPAMIESEHTWDAIGIRLLELSLSDV